MVEQSLNSSESRETTKPEFIVKLEQQWQKGKFISIGLDPVLEQIPDVIKDKTDNIAWQISGFNLDIIEATHDLVCAYKINTAFYEPYGEEGAEALWTTMNQLNARFPEVFVVLDYKRGDMPSSNLWYVRAAFGQDWEVDAVTVNP